MRARMGASVEGFWKRWAELQGARFDGYLSFEEFLTIEPVDRKLYFRPYSGRFSVEFDVNMGEFDRVYQRTGKLAVDVDLEIPGRSLRYLIETRRGLLPGMWRERQRLGERLSSLLADAVDRASDKFPVPLWRYGMEDLIASELLEQFALYKGEPPRSGVSGKEVVSLTFHVSPFALSYVRNKFLAAGHTNAR